MPAALPPIEVTASTESLAEIIREVTNGMIVQNARLGRRLDPLGKRRTAQVEGRLMLWLRVLSVLLLLLAVPAWVLHQHDGIIVHGCAVLGFVILLASFGGIDRMRRGMVRWTDRQLARTAVRLTRRIAQRIPAIVRYELDGARLLATWRRTDQEEPIASTAFPLDQFPYVLVGASCAMAFPKPKALRPTLIVLMPTAREDRSAFLDAWRKVGPELELLREELLPQTTVPRTFVPQARSS